jgi:hypothetical protein
MSKLLCWLFGHERMVASPKVRECIRCGLRERRLLIGEIIAWEDVTAAPVRL